jgi:hypothetical protein
MSRSVLDLTGMTRLRSSSTLHNINSNSISVLKCRAAKSLQRFSASSTYSTKKSAAGEEIRVQVFKNECVAKEKFSCSTYKGVSFVVFIACAGMPRDMFILGVQLNS